MQGLPLHMHSVRALLQETATTLVGMLLGMAFTQVFNGQLLRHIQAKPAILGIELLH